MSHKKTTLWFTTLLCLFALFMYLTRAQPSRCDTVLFLADYDNCTLTTPGDLDVLSLAEERHTVEVLCSRDVSPELAAEYALVVITQSALSSNVVRMAKANVPMIVYEEHAFRRLKMADSGQSNAMTGIRITAPNHPLAANYSGRLEVTRNCDVECTVGSIVNGGGSTEIARRGDKRAVYVYEKGSELVDGSTARAMRIGLFVGISGLTGEAENITRAAIEYAFNGGLCVDKEEVIDTIRVIDGTQVIKGHLVLTKDGILQFKNNGTLIVEGCVFLFGRISITGDFDDGYKLIEVKNEYCKVSTTSVETFSSEECKLSLRQDLLQLFANPFETCGVFRKRTFLSEILVILCLFIIVM